MHLAAANQLDRQCDGDDESDAEAHPGQGDRQQSPEEPRRECFPFSGKRSDHTTQYGRGAAPALELSGPIRPSPIGNDG